MRSLTSSLLFRKFWEYLILFLTLVFYDFIKENETMRKKKMLTESSSPMMPTAAFDQKVKKAVKPAMM